MPLNAGISVDALPKAAAEGLHHGKGKVRVVTLVAGSRLFRGGSTHRLDGTEFAKGDTAEWALSSWWFTEEVYKRIVEVYQKSGGGYLNSLSMTLRRAGAVKQSWNRLDVRIKAEVLQDINAFEGIGSTQIERFDNGVQVVWDGWRADAKQLYIPNLDWNRSKWSNGSVLYFDDTPALRILTKKTISSEQPFGEGGV